MRPHLTETPNGPSASSHPLPVRSDPFPHVVIDDWWDEELLRRVLDEFPDPAAPGWRRYANSRERKLEGPPGLWGPATWEAFREMRSLTPYLETAFGIANLALETVGGGYHAIEPGGYLQMHTDFNRSPNTGRYRRLNLLVYLNDDWQDPGGHLELWDGGGPVVDVAPEFNRTLVFQTSDRSWHGHPKPAQRWRRSLAAYFFTEQEPDGYSGEHSTVWWRGAS